MRNIVRLLMAAAGLAFFILIMASAQDLFGAPQNNGALLPFIPLQFTNGSGVAASNARLCSLAAGTTTSWQATYQNASLATPNANPQVLSATGHASTPIYLDALSYKFILYLPYAGVGSATCNGTPVGTAIWTLDNVYDFAQLGVFVSINNRQYCSTGTNAGLKMAAAYARLPSTGGIIDCSNLQGAQSITADPFTGGTKPYFLLLGGTTLAISAAVSVPTGSTVQGIGASATIVSVVSTANLVGFSVIGNNVTLQDMTISVSKGSGTTARAIECDAACTNLHVDNVEIVGVGAVTLDNYGIVQANFAINDLLVTNSRFTNLAYVYLKGNSDVSNTVGFRWSNNTITGTVAGINPNHPGATGQFSDIEIDNLRCDGSASTGWCIGLSGQGIKDAKISNSAFINCVVECIHIEDRASNITVSNSFFSKGTSTTTIADRAMLYAITGSHEITSTGNHYDLTGNSGSTAWGFGTVAGSGTPPYNTIVDGDSYLTKSGTIAVVVSEGTSAIISNSSFSNPNTASKASYFIDATAKQGLTGGHNTFGNAGPIVNVNNNSYGTLSDSEIVGDVSTTAFLTGNTAGNVSVTFANFGITRAFTADNVITQNTLFPAGQSFSLKLGMRFVQNGTSVGWVSRADTQWDGANFSVADMVRTCGTSDTCGPSLNQSAGSIRGQSQRLAGAAVGTIHITALGVITP